MHRLDGATDVPVNPFRSGLYSEAELLGSFDESDDASYATTLDFVAYRNYVMNGRRIKAPYIHSIAHAVHDNSITQAIGRFATDHRIVAIMGGHKLARSSAPYRRIVLLAKRLAEADFTLASGGGPGAMEATHAGAGLAGAGDNEVEQVLTTLAREPDLPEGLDRIVADDGAIDGKVLRALHRWQAPAFAVARSRAPGADSLAIPTWHYGHEPPTPLATHIGKYYENSIREDGLLALATRGIVFAEGRAGTIQEIFQDAAQNYYRSFGWFSPMVLLGTDYWQRQVPVEPVLRALFDDRDEQMLTVTDDVDEAIAALVSFQPPRRAGG